MLVEVIRFLVSLSVGLSLVLVLHRPIGWLAAQVQAGVRELRQMFFRREVEVDLVHKEAIRRLKGDMISFERALGLTPDSGLMTYEGFWRALNEGEVSPEAARMASVLCQEPSLAQPIPIDRTRRMRPRINPHRTA